MDEDEPRRRVIIDGDDSPPPPAGVREPLRPKPPDPLTDAASADKPESIEDNEA